MKTKTLAFSVLLAFCTVLGVRADILQPSVTLPADGKPEHLYTMVNGNKWYLNANTSPTQTEDNYALFAFYAVEGTADAYYIYNYTAGKWLNYAKAESYSNGVAFVTLGTSRVDGVYWAYSSTASGDAQFQPYNTTGVAAKYMNFYGGTSSYSLDGTTTVGLWQNNGNQDAGSRWTLSEVDMTEYAYTVTCAPDVAVTVNGKSYQDGDVVRSLGHINQSLVSATVPDGKFPVVHVNSDDMLIIVQVLDKPEQPLVSDYTIPGLYPMQQDEVGQAGISAADGVYTLHNNVLAASFIRTDNRLYFAGSEAMNLKAGTEPFFVSFGNGDQIAASQMELASLDCVRLEGDADAVGGAEHYNGYALVANYRYTYGGGTVNIEWRAVLRDGSHYLRTEMQLTGEGDVDMYNVIPMIYNVDTKAAGSVPAVVGNTRGAVLMSDRIFAGLENPVGYNTVGEVMGSEDKYDLTSTLPQVAFAASGWTQTPQDEVPGRVTEVSKYGYPNIYEYRVADVTLKANQKLQTTIAYTGGNHRLNFAGVDLLDTNGDVVASDYHSGYSGNASSGNEFSFIVPDDGTYTVRCMVENGTETIDASGIITCKVFTPKDGVVIDSDVVTIQGRWSRNTTLADGETWKISAVVGLVAQDGQQANPVLSKTQKRRSFLAYSERERAVPWHCNPVYISWYELNINRNNSSDPTKNMNASQVENVLRHWKSSFYDRFGLAPNSFVIDDGWDNYGTWTFHDGFPDEMRGISALAGEMGAGVGAWLGPVGGYGTSGNYRRAYWTAKGQSMVLSNPDYYKVFLDAAENLTQNQGNFNFFKFDGISAQFSATGPDSGDSGNENAEGIIRLERYVRENLRRDIFFNTTVGTWASPFWYHYTDATWRQENDYGTLGDNTSDRERWITYRDKLVYQNYVANSPVCPINTLMTHGFILSRFGSVSKDMSYQSCLREMRCAFACGSGMVELYNDYLLMDTINGGQLWADLADCIRWQRNNADVLMDIHWVGGSPWDGSKANIYGWAAWNGSRSVFTLRNGANGSRSITLTLREALEIPANITGSVVLHKSFADQPALNGLAEGEAIDIDTPLTLTLPGSSVYVFEGLDASLPQVKVETVEFTRIPSEVYVGGNVAVVASVTPSDATCRNLEWVSSDPSVATVCGGFVKPLGEGSVTITAKALDGSDAKCSIVLTVASKPVDPYAVNFDKDASAQVTYRKLNAVTLTAGGTDNTVTLASDKPYQMLTDDFTAKTGDKLTVSLNWTGTWMHGYVYCDYDQNCQYDVTSPADRELVSYTYYNGTDSEGKTRVSSCGVGDLPSFTAPQEEGVYMLRVKVDWDNVDPGGSTVSGNDILGNGGCIIDIPLTVEDPSGITAVSDDGDAVAGKCYDLSGRPVSNPGKGQLYIRRGRIVRE